MRTIHATLAVVMVACLQVSAVAPAPAAVTADASYRLPVRMQPRPLWRWPVIGRVSSQFGWRVHPITNQRQFHTGIDIATALGAPVRAARAGVVLWTGEFNNNGLMVILDHGGGWRTDYSHMSAALVRSGRRVHSGELIGRVGSTGMSTGPHLLFEVRLNRQPVDPLVYLPPPLDAPAAGSRP